MKSVSTYLRSFAVFAFALTLSFGMLNAQEVTENRGTMGLTEGRHYMVAFPQVWASTSEKPLPKPMQLFISSRSDAKIRVRTPAQNNAATPIDREFEVKADEVLKVDIPIPYMNEESQSRNGYGIEVTGNKPISVSTFQAWFGNGELARHLPVEAWGDNYYSMNFYQDRYGSVTQGYKYRPGQILIIAAYDNTFVSYTPVVETEGGRDGTSVPKDGSGTVELMKGETFLIKAKINEANNKDWTSDLSGTWIRSSRPVGVISGHTKVAIMRYPDVLPPTGNNAAEAHFVRNNVHDAMLPFEMAGTEFVTTPCMYTSTRVTGKTSTEFGIDDDQGDVIRFVALEDNTVIEQMREDGSGFKPIKSLRRGETWVETSVQVAAMWRSNNPIMVGQYGKSYAKIIPPEVRKPGGPSTQGHPTVESGMPMLQYVPPIDRWVNYGVFHSPEGMDNFMNIVFLPEEVGKIKVDGKALNSVFGGSMRPLRGTPFYFIRTPIGQGDHVIESETEDIKWMAWNYGSLDGLQMGRAYGTPMAIDLAIPCDDSLDVQETIICGNVEAEAKILPENVECGSIFGIYAESLDNYELLVDENFSSGDRTGKFTVRVLDPTKDGRAVVKVVSRSGKFVDKIYEYIADKMAYDPDQIDFGVIPFNTPVCKEFTFTNLRDDAPLTVNDVRAKYFPNTFKFSPSNFVIPPGGSRTIQVCATITEPQTKVDTVIAELECFEMLTTELRVKGAEPKIFVGDYDWGEVSVNSDPTEQQIRIVNAGNVDVIIDGYDQAAFDASPNFTYERGLENLPITLKGGQEHFFYVTYDHTGQADVQHELQVPFYTNARIVDTLCVLKGKAIMSVLDAVVRPWNERVIDVVQTDQGINQYEQTVSFSNFGKDPVTFTEPIIVGADAAAFEIVNFGNTGGFPVQLVSPANGKGPNTTKNITIAFKPTELPNRGAERDNYEAELVFPNNAGIELRRDLSGIAWQPQVKGLGHDYGTFNVGEARVTMDLPIVNAHMDDVSNPTTGDANGTHAVVVTDIRFVGADNNFEILNAPTMANPWRLGEGETQLLQVRFDPRQAGNFAAQYEIVTQPADMTDGAAPYTPRYDLTANVLGGFEVEGDSADQYVLNTRILEIKITHPYSQTARFSISDAMGPDASRFTVDPSLNGFIDVAPNETGIVRVAFVPDYITKMSAGQDPALLAGKGNIQGLNTRANYFYANVEITDEFSSNTETATVAGNGLYLETTDFIADNYVVNVGNAVDVAVELRADPQSLNEVQLTGIRTRMSFDDAIVRPRVRPEDIILNGTLTEGWTVLSVADNGNNIEIDIADQRPNKTPLVNDGRPMFKVTFDSYLGSSHDPDAPFESPVTVYSYPVDHLGEWPVGTSKNYALFNDIPGKITVNQDCAEGLRLVSISNTNFAVQPIAPNPVSTTGVINYSIGLSGQTTIVLYNQMGEEVMSLVDMTLAAGDYELSFDSSELPAGTYYYRVVSGPYISEPQTITVVH